MDWAHICCSAYWDDAACCTKPGYIADIMGEEAAAPAAPCSIGTEPPCRGMPRPAAAADAGDEAEEVPFGLLAAPRRGMVDRPMPDRFAKGKCGAGRASAAPGTCCFMAPPALLRCCPPTPPGCW